MSNFKTGDKVKCINVGGNAAITEGKIYEVMHDSHDSHDSYDAVHIKADDENIRYIYKSRFILVKETPNKDSKSDSKSSWGF